MSNEYSYNTIPTELGFLEKRKFLNFYNQYVGNSDFCITIGDSSANVSATLLKLGAMVLIVEPLPESVDFVQKKLDKQEHKIILHEDIGAFNAEFTYNQAYEKNILPYSSNLTVSENQSVVKITTVDELIRVYGVPTFLMINANGYENDVLKGLSKPILTLSVAFYSYLKEKTIEVMRRLMHIGDYEFNWILNEEAKFQSKEWMSAKALHASMADHNEDRFSGFIFARIIGS
jgi:FkbM family methyltransferase